MVVPEQKYPAHVLALTPGGLNGGGRALADNPHSH